MLLLKISIIFVFLINFCTSDTKYRELITDAKFNQEYRKQINVNNEYVFEFQHNTKIYPARVEVRSPQATKEYPLLVVAQQQKNIQSWQIPDHDEQDAFLNQGDTAHTLCPETIKYFTKESTRTSRGRKLNPSECSNPTVVVKTLSPTNIEFTLKVFLVEQFFLTTDREYTFGVSATAPVYYYYNFHDAENSTKGTDAVLISANSNTMTCMLFSIQNSTCPVLDLENNMKYDSYWQTMSKQSAMVITKRNYPNGFFIVMVVKKGDEECNVDTPSTFLLQRRKTVTLKISPAITMKEHNTIAYATLGFFAGFLVIALVGGIFYFLRTLRLARKTLQEVSTDDNDDVPSRTNCVALCTLSCDSENRNATNYVWLVTIVILFYILPVLQVAVTYQGIVNETGNDDICYYNFLCALPQNFGMYIMDFNHVLSNIGYIFLGIVFIILTHLKSIRDCTKHKEGFGLMKPYGMYYALGISLVMEGVMSACYHICPKKSNFQFDTSFMYVMTVLMIVNVYEVRKDDADERQRDERGYIVFFTLAGVTLISVIGSYVGTKTSFWIIITIVHIFACMIITWAVENFYIKNILGKIKSKNTTNKDLVHGVLLIFINMANIGLAVFGLIEKKSFATHVLTILIANGVLYTMFYIIMKVMHKEKIVWQTPVLIVLAFACWIPALYFFLANVTNWEDTPAESRNQNEKCLFVNYYDTHDIWHFLSAFALFFTCWILLTLDEGLNKVPRDDIVDFHADRALCHRRNAENSIQNNE